MTMSKRGSYRRGGSVHGVAAIRCPLMSGCQMGKIEPLPNPSGTRAGGFNCQW